MSLQPISDTISPEIKFSIVEDTAGVVDGEHVLAKIRGQFFVPDGTSRNGRFYPKALWERVIKDPVIQRQLSKRLMFGTIGHDGGLKEKDIREGLVSHFMTSIEIDKSGHGIGEAYILNTPCGKILNTMLSAGSELAVSSRANGTFKGKTKDGLAIVDEETYDIDGWDFVLDPGFLEANPSIAESIEENFKELETKNKPREVRMGQEKDIDAKLVEHIANENSELKTKVGDLTDEVTALEESKKTLTEDNTHLKAEIVKCEGDKKIIEGFQALGTVEEIQEKLNKAEADAKILEGYNELADTPEQAKEIMEKAQAFITSTKEMGTLEEIKEALEKAVTFKKEVDELGSTEQIKEALTAYLTILEEKEATEKAATTKALAEKLGLEEEKVTTLLEKYSAEDIEALHGTVKPEEKIEETFVKKNFEDKAGEAGTGDLSESRILGSSRIDRINERFNKN